MYLRILNQKGAISLDEVLIMMFLFILGGVRV